LSKGPFLTPTLQDYFNISSVYPALGITLAYLIPYDMTHHDDESHAEKHGIPGIGLTD
jgi:hypothetical protein